MTDSTKTWVYDNVEVTKTGRIAQNKTRSGKSLELVEITPVDQRMVGTWKKWVRDSDLFEVVS
jgi:hypothetical protein